MQGECDETVGPDFSPELLEKARDQTLALILESAKMIRPGVSETQAKAIVQELQTKMGAPKSWHPPQIRFGKNTCLPFGVRGEENKILQENDIFFLDLGPIFEGHEGDVGRPFSVGSDPEMKECCEIAEKIWFEVRDPWKTYGVSGHALYEFAKNRAGYHGWVLSLDKADGHRIADFPHAARTRGSIEGFTQTPASHRWILEIQIRHKSRDFGAFYEDLLS